MYKITRQQAAELLNMSTRSIDRYIRAGKLRSKKDGKIIYIHEADIDNIASGWKKKQEVIVPHQETVEKKESTKIVSNQNTSSALEKVYIDLREEMKRKDSAIQELSIRLGRAEEIAKNSVSLIEFKKSQFLLEESKGFLNKEPLLRGRCRFDSCWGYHILKFHLSMRHNILLTKKWILNYFKVFWYFWTYLYYFVIFKFLK